jgi:hypothetical protein
MFIWKVVGRGSYTRVATFRFMEVGGGKRSLVLVLKSEAMCVSVPTFFLWVGLVNIGNENPHRLGNRSMCEVGGVVAYKAVRRCHITGDLYPKFGRKGTSFVPGTVYVMEDGVTPEFGSRGFHACLVPALCYALGTGYTYPVDPLLEVEMLGDVFTNPEGTVVVAASMRVLRVLDTLDLGSEPVSHVLQGGKCVVRTLGPHLHAGDDQPAFEFSDGHQSRKEWWTFGVRHRVGGKPAIEVIEGGMVVPSAEVWRRGRRVLTKDICKL